MTVAFHPKRGRGRVNTKHSFSEKTKVEREYFDWESEALKSKEGSIGLIKKKNVKSALIIFVVLETVTLASPGSGAGLFFISGVPQRLDAGD